MVQDLVTTIFVDSLVLVLVLHVPSNPQYDYFGGEVLVVVWPVVPNPDDAAVAEVDRLVHKNHPPEIFPSLDYYGRFLL